MVRTSRSVAMLIVSASFAVSPAVAGSPPAAPQSYGRPAQVARASPRYQPPPRFNFRKWRWTFPGSCCTALPFAILIGTAALKWKDEWMRRWHESQVSLVLDDGATVAMLRDSVRVNLGCDTRVFPLLGDHQAAPDDATIDSVRQTANPKPPMQVAVFRSTSVGEFERLVAIGFGVKVVVLRSDGARADPAVGIGMVG